MKTYDPEKLQAAQHNTIIALAELGILNRPGEYLLMSLIGHLGAVMGTHGAKMGIAMGKGMERETREKREARG